MNKKNKMQNNLKEDFEFKIVKQILKNMRFKTLEIITQHRRLFVHCKYPRKHLKYCNH